MNAVPLNFDTRNDALWSTDVPDFTKNKPGIMFEWQDATCFFGKLSECSQKSETIPTISGKHKIFSHKMVYVYGCKQLLGFGTIFLKYPETMTAFRS